MQYLFLSYFFVFVYVFCSCTLIVLEHVCRPSLLCNARCNPCLLNKIDNTHDFSLIAITESWLHDHIYNNEILLTGYTIYRKDRCSKGGGVMLAVKSTFICTQLDALNNLDHLSPLSWQFNNLCCLFATQLLKWKHPRPVFLYHHVNFLSKCCSNGWMQLSIYWLAIICFYYCQFWSSLLPYNWS